MNRLQKDLQKLHKTIAKESEEILKKANSKEFRDNIETTRRELQKVVTHRLEVLEPAYKNCLTHIQKNLAKAGVHIDKLDDAVGVVPKKTSKGKTTSSKKKKAKATSVKKKTSKKVTSKKQSSKKSVAKKKKKKS